MFYLNLDNCVLLCWSLTDCLLWVDFVPCTSNKENDKWHTSSGLEEFVMCGKGYTRRKCHGKCTHRMHLEPRGELCSGDGRGGNVGRNCVLEDDKTVI